MDTLTDRFRRPVRDLRWSVTDLCNFLCTYCMPKELFGKDHEFLPRGELLSFDEISMLVALFVERGVEKVRITGGEPLLRKDLEKLIGMLRSIDGARDLTLTTNASLLARKARRLGRVG